MIYLLYLITVGLELISIAEGTRNVAALTDYCRRFSSSPLCPGAKSGSASGQPPPNPSSSSSAPTAPPLPSAASSAPGQSPQSGPSTNAIQYCNEYSAHYRWYCIGGGVGDQKAAEFCPSYSQICGVPPGPAGGQGAGQGSPAAPVVSNNPLCTQYAPVAATYCTGPGTESIQFKQSCDQYRASCSAPGATPVQPVVVNQQQALCYQYERQYVIICVQQRPVTPGATQFCQEYGSLCLGKGRKRRWALMGTLDSRGS